ncbi:MAG: hypothetical protein MK102_02380 [Fuerstiella sp.]|nr:hypothetical protein [Fuerstiella sp.]
MRSRSITQVAYGPDHRSVTEPLKKTEATLTDFYAVLPFATGQVIWTDLLFVTIGSLLLTTVHTIMRYGTMRLMICLCTFLLTCSTFAQSADSWGLERGTPDLQSAGALAFGPDDILFVGDTKSATVFAIATGDSAGDPTDVDINIDHFRTVMSDVCDADTIINDLVVNPRTGTIFVSGAAGDVPAICQIDGSGRIIRLSLENVPFAKTTLPNVPEDRLVQRGRRKRNFRKDAITDIAFYEGRILISGLRAGDAPSSVREFSFPFSAIDRGTGIAIYHAAHGREEDYAAARTFVTLMIDGEPNLLAAYTCTPLVKIPLNELRKAEDRIQATTVAELGNRNRPLDMISYKRNGTGYLLLSNDRRGVMKITTSGLRDNKGLSEPVRRGGKAGQTYEKIDSLHGVVQMDQLNDDSAIVLIQQDEYVNLKTVPLP